MLGLHQHHSLTRVLFSWWGLELGLWVVQEHRGTRHWW